MSSSSHVENTSMLSHLTTVKGKKNLEGKGKKILYRKGPAVKKI